MLARSVPTALCAVQWSITPAGYGLSVAFRRGLRARLTCAVGIPKHQTVYFDDIVLIFPVAGNGDTRSTAAETSLAPSTWKTFKWRRGTQPVSAVPLAP